MEDFMSKQQTKNLVSMINEDYVGFEVAKLLKEKGFDEPVMYHFTPDGAQRKFQQAFYRDDVAQPTLQMARKWLIKNYNIHIEVRYFPMPNIYRYVIIHSPATFENINSHPQYFNTYEEACESAIKYCLTNLI